jgi:hypothetical protein
VGFASAGSETVAVVPAKAAIAAARDMIFGVLFGIFCSLPRQLQQSMV